MKFLLKTSFLTLALLFSKSVLADVPLVYSEENTGTSCKAPPLPNPQQCPNVPKLPDPFEWSDGSGKVKNMSDWECRRNEIKAEIENYELGKKPPPPQSVKATYSGGTLTVVVNDKGGSLTLTSKLNVPSGSGPFPIIIGMNSGTGSLGGNLFQGFIQVPFMHDQTAKYAMSGQKDTNAPFYKLYPDLRQAGDYIAWSWGVSRLIDGLDQVKEQINADMAHIGVTGCSYAGKMAMFAGAFDERIALTMAQESGGGGINSWRVSDTIGNVEKIDNTNYSWFMQSLKTNFGNNRAGRLPYDHHEAIAMVAPRAFFAFGNPDYEWLGDKSGYTSAMAALEVWKAMGVEDRFGFNFSGGHTHCQAHQTQNSDVQKFIDKFLRGKSDVNTSNVLNSSVKNDVDSWISAWKGHKIDTSDAGSGSAPSTQPAQPAQPDEPASSSQPTEPTQPEQPSTESGPSTEPEQPSTEPDQSSQSHSGGGFDGGFGGGAPGGGMDFGGGFGGGAPGGGMDFGGGFGGFGGGAPGGGFGGFGGGAPGGGMDFGGGFGGFGGGAPGGGFGGFGGFGGGAPGGGFGGFGGAPGGGMDFGGFGGFGGGAPGGGFGGFGGMDFGGFGGFGGGAPGGGFGGFGGFGGGAPGGGFGGGAQPFQFFDKPKEEDEEDHSNHSNHSNHSTKSKHSHRTKKITKTKVLTKPKQSSQETPKPIKTNDDACWSKKLGFSCCKDNSTVYFTDENGSWGVEDGKWCGIVEN